MFPDKHKKQKVKPKHVIASCSLLLLLNLIW